NAKLHVTCLETLFQYLIPNTAAFTMLRTAVLILYVCFGQNESASIVNGFGKPIEPPPGAFPFQAGLMQLLDDKKSYHTFCGGSLIHPEWILTAAHCIQLDAESPAMKTNETFIAVGSVYRNGRGGQIIRAKGYKIHPDYLSTGFSDIGLIKLVKPARLGIVCTRKIKPCDTKT
ncbi:Trypsin, partial [Oryctes borbonicus]